MKKLGPYLRTLFMAVIVAVGLSGLTVSSAGDASAALVPTPVGKFYLTIKNLNNRADVTVRMTLTWGSMSLFKSYLTVISVPTDGKKVNKRVGLPGGSITLSGYMSGSKINYSANMSSAVGKVRTKTWKLLAVDGSKILTINGNSVF